MTATRDEGAEDVLSENILRITDELVRQIDRSKKLVIVMIVVVVIAVPVSWHAAPLLNGTPANFMLVGYFTVLIAIAFLALGIRQWMVLSKWTERYRAYKELQQKIDARLDFEEQSAAKGSPKEG